MTTYWGIRKTWIKDGSDDLALNNWIRFWCHLPKRGRPWNRLILEHMNSVFTMLNLSCLLDIEGELSEKLFRPQWKGPNWRLTLENLLHGPGVNCGKLSKTVHQFCNLSCLCATFSQKKISSIKWYGNYYLGFCSSWLSGN